VSVPRNISVPLFIGPLYTDGDYYFICRIVYTESLEVEFDVILTFDGKRPSRDGVKKIPSTSSRDVIYKPQDLAGKFGKTVSKLIICSISDAG